MARYEEGSAEFGEAVSAEEKKGEGNRPLHLSVLTFLLAFALILKRVGPT